MTSEAEYLIKISPFLNRKVRARSKGAVQWRYYFIIKSVIWDFYPKAQVIWRYVDHQQFNDWSEAEINLNGYDLEGFDLGGVDGQG